MGDMVIIDGANMVHRYWHGIKPTTLYALGGNRIFNNVLQGWFDMLCRMVEGGAEAEDIVVVFDGGACAARDLYPPYKAQRSEKPPGLLEQIPVLRKMTAWLGARVVVAPDEADPSMAYLARREAAAGRRAAIVTSDKDLMQCVRDGSVRVIRPGSGREMVEYREDDVFKKMGVGPRAIPALLALAGDSSDNIPGVAGVGPVKARALLERYGSITGIIGAVERGMVRGKMAATIAASVGDLATFLAITKLRDVPVELPEPCPNHAMFMAACPPLGLTNQLERLMSAGAL